MIGYLQFAARGRVTGGILPIMPSWGLTADENSVEVGVYNLKITENDEKEQGNNK